ncbi:MAG: hypothetical protein ACFB0B_15505 [Thermonemataceae bacterium]
MTVEYEYEELQHKVMCIEGVIRRLPSCVLLVEASYHIFLRRHLKRSGVTASVYETITPLDDGFLVLFK